MGGSGSSGSSSVLTGPPTRAAGQPAKLWATTRAPPVSHAADSRLLRALRAEAVGGGERPLEAPEVEVAGQRGHLVDDRVGLRGGDGGAHRVAVEAVEDDRLDALRPQALHLRGSAGGAGDGVAVAEEEGDERLTDGAGRPGEEDVHASPTRRRASL